MQSNRTYVQLEGSHLYLEEVTPLTYYQERRQLQE